MEAPLAAAQLPRVMSLCLPRLSLLVEGASEAAGLNPNPEPLVPEPHFNHHTQTPNPKPKTQNPKPKTQNPKLQILLPKLQSPNLQHRRGDSVPVRVHRKRGGGVGGTRGGWALGSS